MNLKFIYNDNKLLNKMSYLPNLKSYYLTVRCFAFLGQKIGAQKTCVSANGSLNFFSLFCFLSHWEQLCMHVDTSKCQLKLNSHFPTSICRSIIHWVQGSAHIRKVCAQRGRTKMKLTQPWKQTQGNLKRASVGHELLVYKLEVLVNTLGALSEQSCFPKAMMLL